MSHLRFLCSFLVALVAACSGGSDPVRTMGGFGEDPGPGNPRLPGEQPSWGSVSHSALEVLCLEACVKRHATDCTQEPKEATDACASECANLGQMAGQCADEIAELYDCKADATYVCDGGVALTSDCADETGKVDSCLVPGGTAGCVNLTENDSFCQQSFGLPSYFVCSQSAPPNCIEVAPGEFCCP